MRYMRSGSSTPCTAFLVLSEFWVPQMWAVGEGAPSEQHFSSTPISPGVPVTSSAWSAMAGRSKSGDSFGEAPLLRSRLRAVEFLLSAGADPSLADVRGLMLLTMAQVSDLRLAQVLLESPLGHRAAGASAVKRAVAEAPSGKFRNTPAT